jgi:segregation and condensation protein B
VSPEQEPHEATEVPEPGTGEVSEAAETGEVREAAETREVPGAAETAGPEPVSSVPVADDGTSSAISPDTGSTSDTPESTSDETPSTSDGEISTSDVLASTEDDGDEAVRVEELRPRRGGAEPVGPVSDEDLRSAVEAILLVVDTPVGEVTLAQVLERPTATIRAALEELAADYTVRSRGMELRRVAGGWRLYTRDAYAPYVERFVLDGQQARLTQAALETLAVVAYRQPVTRARISGIRGVGVDGVIRTLVTRGLIEECGAEQESGAHLYRTTTLFLEKLGLDSLEQLPSLAPLLPEIEALDDVIGSP